MNAGRLSIYMGKIVVFCKAPKKLVSRARSKPLFMKSIFLRAVQKYLYFIRFGAVGSICSKNDPLGGPESVPGGPYRPPGAPAQPGSPSDR